MKKFFIDNSFCTKRNDAIRKTASLFAVFALLSAISSCSDNKPPKNSPSPFTEQTLSSDLQVGSGQDLNLTESSVKRTKVYATSPFREEIDSGEIKINEFGSYSGEYVEDGSNRPVENVAAIRVTNKSNRFLDFATVTVNIDNKTATFIISGLPAGKCTWVLEQSCMAISDKAAFEFVDCTASFSDKEIISSTDKLSVQSDGDYMTVSNLTGEKLHNVVIYYRNLHDDGNYLGGITYRVTVGSINANDSSTVIAGHYSEEKSEIIRIDF